MQTQPTGHMHAPNASVDSKDLTLYNGTPTTTVRQNSQEMVATTLGAQVGCIVPASHVPTGRSDVRDSCPAVTANPKHNLVSTLNVGVG